MFKSLFGLRKHKTTPPAEPPEKDWPILVGDTKEKPQSGNSGAEPVLHQPFSNTNIVAQKSGTPQPVTLKCGRFQPYEVEIYAKYGAPPVNLPECFELTMIVTPMAPSQSYSLERNEK